MADERGPQFFMGGRNTSGLTNFLLLLILIGVFIIILLLLWRFWWWQGVAVGDGRVIETSGGGGITINSACCDGGGRTDCPPPTTYSCEDTCKQRYPTDARGAAECIRVKCNGGGEKTCEDTCKDRYPADTAMQANCVRMECDGGDTCQQSCWRRYGASGGEGPYMDCVRRECQEPTPTETCEDYCKTVYGSPGMENYYQQCLRERECSPGTTTTTTAGTVVPPKSPECRDSDGYNLATSGKVVSGDETHSDSCYSSSTVTEWTCKGGKPFERREPCAGLCQYGACVPGSSSQSTSTAGSACQDRCRSTYSSPELKTYLNECLNKC